MVVHDVQPLHICYVWEILLCLLIRTLSRESSGDFSY